MTVKTRLKNVEKKFGIHKKMMLIVPVKFGTDYKTATQKAMTDLGVSQEQIGLTIKIVMFGDDVVLGDPVIQSMT